MPSSAWAANAARARTRMRFIGGLLGAGCSARKRRFRQAMCGKVCPPVPLRTSQVFVRAGSLDDLGEALGRALQKCRRPGEASEEERDPVPPRFRDVEAVAWELLEYLGVPPALRLLPLRHIEVRQRR